MMRLIHCTLLSAVLVWALPAVSFAWTPSSRPATVTSSTRTLLSQPGPHPLVLYSTKEKPATTTSSSNSIDETTKKYGLEAGLMKSLQQKDGGESAKSLLKKYGIAYLATSIPLAIISFAICYWLVDQGVDVGALLAKVGIETSSSGSTTGSTAETAGTLAIAYAAHKAASPIRFPPTVLLTPVVAKWIGKEPVLEEGEDEQ